MRRLVVIPVILIASVLATPTDAYACSCAGTTPQRAVARADVAFVGTVEAMNASEISAQFGDEFGLLRVVRIDVERAIKGVVRRHTLVKTQLYGASCGFEFQLRERYLVYASDRGIGPPETNLCNGTALAEGATFPEQVVGAKVIPGADRNWLWWLPWSVGGLIAAITGIIVVVVRRRRRLIG